MWNLVDRRKCPHKKSVFSSHFLICLAFFVSIFGDVTCLSSCSSELNRNHEKLPLPRLKLWRKNETFPTLDHPGDQVVELPALVESFDGERKIVIKGWEITCTAPYPVLLVALMANDSEDEFKMSSMKYFGSEKFQVFSSKGFESLETTDHINYEHNVNPITLSPNSTLFETRAFSLLVLSVERNVSVFACEAVHNPCLGSAAKLEFRNHGITESQNATKYEEPIVNVTVGMTANSQPHLHPFLTSSYRSLPMTRSKNMSSSSSGIRTNSYGMRGSDSSATANGTQAESESESDCDAIFYYKTVEGRSSMFAQTNYHLAYSCKFSDGSPGIVKIDRCTNRGRCIFPHSREQSVKENCWKHFSPGESCTNCTTVELSFHMMDQFVPFCVSRETASSSTSMEMPVTTTTTNPPVNHWLVSLFGSHLRSNSLKHFIRKQDMADGIRVVKGTPLYLGFPTGFNISRPDIRTWDGENGGNERMIHMRVFEEVQLVNSILEITCDSSARYTASGFAYAFKFQNETELKFLKISNGTEPSRLVTFVIGVIYTQTVSIPLDETDLEVERVFCFAPVQNTYSWINSSRPLRLVSDVQDVFEPSICKTPAMKALLNDQPFPNPTLLLKSSDFLGDYDVIAENGTEEESFDDRQYHIRCAASIPIQLIHTSIYRDRQSFMGFDAIHTFDRVVQYEGGIAATSQFSLEGFDLRAPNHSHFFRCQSTKNPCLHRSFQFFWAHHPPKKQLMIRHFPHATSQLEAVKTELGRPPKYEECEVLFFYKETPEFPFYEFRCEFSMERQGTVDFHYCDSINDCANTFRNRRQSSKCWRKVKSWENCDWSCQIQRARGIQPFVATCSFQEPDDDRFLEGGMPRSQESTLGSFAVFGLSPQPEEMPPIYFSEEEIDPRKMTYLEPFDPYQYPGGNLEITCLISAYFNTAENNNVIIAMYFPKTEIVNGYERQVGKPPSLKKEWNHWSLTRRIELRNDTDLSRIACIGNFWKRSNSSRAIHLREPESPEIALLVSDSLGERMIVGRGEKVGADQERQVFFPLSTTNVSLVCHGFGYPPPEISWATAAANKLDVFTQVLNITHRSSRVLLPVVDVGVEGTYICTATTNKEEQVSSSVRVRIKYPVSTSVVVISSVGSCVVLILILALLLFVRRVRKLKRTLRNLTDEEEKQFRFGDTIVDPTENNAGILAAAYDQSLEVSPDFIEIDEKSVLGAGEFGIVRSGFLKLNKTDPNSGVRIAVKMPKFNVTTENFISFLSEIKIMSHVQNHENVLKILGASTMSIKIRRALVALEFCELGNLKNFLRDKKQVFTNEFVTASLTEWEQMDLSEADGGYGDPRDLLPESEKLETLDLLNFSFGIANGMNFLAEKRVIHGDLAARNVLLTQNREVKISDFGFSTQLKSYENYKETNPLSIPWRWFPIEALVKRKFSLKSDCWSFGILLHEIFSLGEDPYPEFDRLDVNVIQRLRDGYRMGKPEFANDDIYDLMSECWKHDPHERPTFADVCQKILNLSSEIVAPKLNFL